MRSNGRPSLLRDIRRDRYLYAFLIPVVLYYVIFRYVPMGGLVIAFKDYNLGKGIWDSPWVGFKHFERLFSSRDFFRVIRNTLALNVYNLIFGFPAPIILALLLNEVRSFKFKRTVQTLIYLPHFISWVIMGGIVINLLSPSSGYVNTLLGFFGLDPIFFMGDSRWWPIAFVASGIWKSMGWGTIIYLAAISVVDPQLYEAAIIDGANKWRQVLHITIPSITATISILLILRLGQMMNIGFEHVFMLQNQAVMDVSDVISTYVFRQGIQGFRYSYTTALGIFRSIIGFILVYSSNRIARKLGGNGIW